MGDLFLLPFPIAHDFDDLRMDFLPSFERAAITDDYLFAFAETGDNLGIVGGLNSERDWAVLNFAIVIHENTVVLSPS